MIGYKNYDEEYENSVPDYGTLTTHDTTEDIDILRINITIWKFSFDISLTKE